MSDLLADCWQRFEWANEDGEALAALSRSFAESNPYGIWIETQGREGTATFRRFIDPAAEAEVFQGMSRLVGSFLDHSRAALNYMAYQIALLDAPANPSLNPEGVEFPIFTSRRLFSEKGYVKQLPDEHRGLLDSVQPYDGQRPGLVLLHELSRIWRHRLIHPARMSTVDVAQAIRTAEGTTLLDLEILYSGPLEDGQEVLRFTFTSDDGNPQVETAVALAPSIDHELCRGRGCVDVLNEITRDTMEAGQVIADGIPDFA